MAPRKYTAKKKSDSVVKAAKTKPKKSSVVTKKIKNKPKSKSTTKPKSKKCAVSSIGVHEFIKSKLQLNKNYNPPPLPKRMWVYRAKKVGGAKTGIAIGRFTDLLFQRVIAKKTRLNLTSFKHKRCRNIFKVLAKHKIEVQTTQTSVEIKSLNIKTKLDGLGLTANKLPCVIEIKTTQYTIEEHEYRYHQKCRNQPLLANQLPNNDYFLHGVQAALGAIGIQELFPHYKNKIKAVVIVAACDGARLYWVQDNLIQLSHYEPYFKNTNVLPAFTTIPRYRIENVKTKFSLWPTCGAVLQQLVSCTYSMGYKLFPKNKLAGFFCSAVGYTPTQKAPTRLALFGLYHIKKDTLCKSKIKLLLDQLKLDEKKLKKRHPQCAIYAYYIHPEACETGFKFIHVNI